MTVPNVRDGGARFRRIAIAFAVGVVVSIAAYFITNAIVEPELQSSGTYVNRNMNPFGFVFWATFLAGAFALTIALGVQNYLARKRARAAPDSDYV
ncbi:MAG TPA: hypothetical protein VIU61_13190 [Kofleriaceae bacterium]